MVSKLDKIQKLEFLYVHDFIRPFSIYRKRLRQNIHIWYLIDITYRMNKNSINKV